MDLNKLDTRKASQTGATLTLKHPITAEPLVDEEAGTEVTITVLGPDSKEYRAFQHKNATKQLNKALERNKRTKVDAAEIDSDMLDLLSQCTVTWNNILVDGARWECNHAKAKELYERFPWIREQVDQFISDRSNFLGN